MESVQIDVRDIDYSWFENVDAILDRDFDLYHLPRHSVERLGEIVSEEEAALIDGHVPARAEVIEWEGKPLEVWTVGVTSLLTRPARPNPINT